MEYKLTVPVAFIAFNRPDTTKLVFEEIRKAKPAELFLICDGPRKNREADISKCQEVRSIIENVDWNCRVYQNYSPENLGCKYRIASGIDWVFSIADKAIILEDDCLPCSSFFRYCQNLLERYENNEEVMSIAGLNTQLADNCVESYYFTKYVDIGAWATWRRAWEKYDVEMKKWREVRKTNLLKDIFQDDWYRKYTSDVLEDIYKGKVITWDYQWQFAVWLNYGLSIAPQYNQFTNIGQSHPDATNKGGFSAFDYLNCKNLEFPLTHPEKIERDLEKDSITDKNRRIGLRYKLPYFLFFALKKIYKRLKVA